MTQEESDKLWSLFNEYREYFGLCHRCYNQRGEKQLDENYLEKQCEFEQKFAELMCRLIGKHEFESDQCGRPEHDYCVICFECAPQLGYKRKVNERGWEKTDG
jgi:hypothetical protein